MKVSIIVPNYNNAEYIERCIKSITNQKTKESMEIIIIDDGSTDNSIKIIDDLIKNEKLKITLLKQYNQNAAIARNRGLEIAQGEYIYFLDSDDEIFSQYTLNELLINIEDNDLVIGNFRIIDEKDREIDNYNSVDHIIDSNDKYKYTQLAPVPSNKIYKKSIIKENNIYFDNVRIGQDLNFYLKYLAMCKKIKLIDKNIYNYRIVNNSMSRAKNYNFMDIYNTMNYIKKFYYEKNLEDEYNKYIAAVAINNFSVQLTKINDINKRYIRSMVLKYFDFCYKEFKVKKNNSKIYKKAVLKYKIKRILLIIKNIYRR